MASKIPRFDGIPHKNLLPPEKHPGFAYEGFRPGETIKLPRGHVLRQGFGAFSVATALDMDCKVPMRDGVSIYANVFRPDHANAPRLPALIAWSPYGKSAGGATPQTYESMGPFHCGVPYDSLSGYETFEGPNPADWVRRGYCVVDADARGACHSEGDIAFWGPQEAEDVYDLIQWCIQQPWCDGNVVMFGNSWLAIAQINHAVRCPHPALKAIAPWEALNDVYKDSTTRGGITSNSAFGDLIIGGFAGYGKAENPFSAVHVRPLYDDYWESKYMDASKLTIPAYLTASYSSRLHSKGSFESFRRAPKETTWLRVHTTHEWHDLYKSKNMDDLQTFYDHFAKGKQNGWQETPRLRLSLLSLVGSVIPTIEERPENATTFPLPQTRYNKFYLDNDNMKLSRSPMTGSAVARYEAHSLTAHTSYSLKFGSYTELSGLPWARLYVSCKEHTDMDIHVSIRKTGVNGNALSGHTYPVPVSIDKLPDINVCKYQGPNGMLRASHRVSQLPKAYQDDYPEYTHKAREDIRPGEIVAVEIPIWPCGMVFGEGEGIQLDIAGHDLKLFDVPTDEREPSDQNQGIHNLYSSQEQQSFLMLPFI